MEQVVVSKNDELLQALRRQSDEILITGDLADRIHQLFQQQLSDEARMGVELGTQGSATLVEPVLNHLLGSFKGVTKEDTAINKQLLTLYKLKRKQPKIALVRLKQLEY
ncbi:MULTISPECIES: hypothetical protein [Enterococcus]|uniref:hypothetical protein n=1 Tax=Enterococcus TaxID=1350 RepID=UPI00065E5A24|nr:MULTISPECIES: hypothetical protein [Enterococcus]